MNDNKFRSPFHEKRTSLKFNYSIRPGGSILLALKAGYTVSGSRNAVP